MQESRQVSIVAFKYPNQGVWLLFYNMTLLMANLEKFDSLDCKFLYVASIPDPLIERNNFFVQYQAGQTNLKLSTIARAKANEHAVYLTSANFPNLRLGSIPLYMDGEALAMVVACGSVYGLVARITMYKLIT